MSLLIKNARVLTYARGPRPRRRDALADAAASDHMDVLVAGSTIATVAPDLTYPPECKVIDARGRLLIPGFIDCHTHLCWAGSRLDEWEQKLHGVPYLDILAAGGGIMSTVRATRAATRQQLADSLLQRLDMVLREGTTTVEVKSGYGLSTEHELKMLRAISDAAARWHGTVVPTALLGHAIDPDVPAPAFVQTVINETLPAVHAEFPSIAIDAYCEKNAWPVDDCVRLFMRAAELGHPIRVHADQFNVLGMVPHAVQLGARSVDHLEASGASEALRLADANTAAVLLPCCGFHLDGRYANARALVDAGAAVVIATNCNPGSAPCFAMPMAIALATRHCGLTPHEAIGAATANAAFVLNLPDRGVIAPGKRADLVLLRHSDERELAFQFGVPHVDQVIAGGKVVK